MVRFCIAPNCKSNDNEILSHRFPKNRELREKWAKCLGIDEFTYEQLEKYVVCTKHFNLEDYRNVLSRFLNYTALPKLKSSNPRSHNLTTSISLQSVKNEIDDDDDDDDDENLINQTTSSNNKRQKINSYEIEINEMPMMTIESKRRKKNFEIEPENKMKMNTTEVEVIDDSDDNDDEAEIIIGYEDDMIYNNLEDQEGGGGEGEEEENTLSSLFILKQKKISEENDQIDSNQGYFEYNFDSNVNENLNDTEINCTDMSKSNTLEIGCQTEEIDDIKEYEDNINDEYSHLTRFQLIELLKESKDRITELESKVTKIEVARSKLLDSLKLFQSA